MEKTATPTLYRLHNQATGLSTPAMTAEEARARGYAIPAGPRCNWQRYDPDHNEWTADTIGPSI